MIGRDVELALVHEVCVGRRRGIALLGPFGIGRTTLANTAESEAHAFGLTAFRVRATPAASTMPFGALAHLMPADSSNDGYVKVRSFVRSLVESSSSRGGLLVVDDAHDLDASSLAALHAVAADGRTRLVVTASTAAVLPATLQRIWKDRLIDDHYLEPLTRSAIRELVEEVLGRAIDDVSNRSVWRLSRGFPTIATIIAERCTWHSRDATMTLASDPVSEPEIRRLVEPILSHLDDEALVALSVLDSDTPLDVDLLCAAFGDDVVDALEQSSVVANESNGGLIVRHALIGAVARASLTSLQRRRAATQLSAVIDDRGGLEAVSPRDLARAARWRLDAGVPCAADILVDVARSALANGEVEVARDLAQSIRADHGASWEGSFILGQAERMLGNHQAAELALENAMSAPDLSSRVDVAIARAELLSISCGRYAEATAQLEALGDTIADPAIKVRLLVERTLLASLVGDFRDVVTTATTATDLDLDDTSAVLVANALGFARLMLLQLPQLDAELVWSTRLADAQAAVFPMLGDQLKMLRVAADQADGRVERSISASVAARTSNEVLRGGIGVGTWSAMEALGRSLAGSDGVADAAQRAASGLSERAPLGLRYAGTLFAATAAATSGDAELAARLTDTAGPASTEVEQHIGQVIVPRIEAWQLAHRGDLDAATALLLDAGRLAIDMSHLYWGMFVLHDAIRFGAAPEALKMLDSIAAEPGTECAWLEAARQHARAEIDGDATRLRGVAAAFSSMGARIVAAEIVWRAAGWSERSGDRLNSDRMRSCAQLMTGDRTPVMRGDSPLTDRQVAVARRAVDGGTSRSIATELGVSARTVENHLAAVYRRLEISGRAELESIGRLAERPASGVTAAR